MKAMIITKCNGVMALIGGRKSGPMAAWTVFVILLFKKILKPNNKKRKRTVLSGGNTKQKTRSHKTQKENENLYMIPNQRQR
jgi:hypothetical protein